MAGRVHNVRILLRYGANPNLPSDFSPNIWWGHSKPALPAGPMLPLSFAARRGQAEILQMLLKAGAKINAKDKKTGMTALHEAAEANQRAIVSALLRAGANRLIRDRKGRTPVNAARQAKVQAAIRAFGG
jgi:ankyrin repeat protein